ncbi:MAG TPA: TonB-dependent receptor plug domain-containing protein, partial [Opitutus sp.]|nr:TonB-dependent receptor plug domain-containing protein [Opitutus sp.]
MKLLLRSVSCCALLASPLLAQTTAPADSTASDEVVQLTEFAVSATQDRGYLSTHSVGGTRTNTALKDIPQKIQIINSELIADSASLNAADATRFISNVQSQDARSDGFRIRGLDAGQTTINGFNVNATVQNELAHIDRIEVMKGPAGVLYGTGRFGGVINLVRKQPQAKRANEIKAQYFSAGSGRLETDFTGSLYHSGQIQVLYRLTAAFQDGELFMDHSEWRRTTYSPTLEVRFGQNTRVTAYYEYFDDLRTNYWGDHLGRNAAGVF